jgi:hypothetical protein
VAEDRKAREPEYRVDITFLLLLLLLELCLL